MIEAGDFGMKAIGIRSSTAAVHGKLMDF